MAPIPGPELGVPGAAVARTEQALRRSSRRGMASRVVTRPTASCRRLAISPHASHPALGDREETFNAIHMGITANVPILVPPAPGLSEMIPSPLPRLRGSGEGIESGYGNNCSPVS